MKHTIQLNTGNFSIILSGEPNAEYVNKCIKNGLIYDLQRGGASKAYLELAGVPGKREGKFVLPDGFERDSIQYTEADAKVMQAAAEKFFSKLLTDVTVKVLPYEKGESTSRKTAQAIYAKWVAADKVEAKLGLLDDVDADSSEDDIIEAIHAQLVNPDKD